MKKTAEERLPLNNNENIASSGSINDLGNRANGDSDQDPLDEELGHLTASQAQRWRHAALAAAWASVFILLGLGSISFVLSATTDSSAAFGFGFGCILDVFTSVVVIWRFYGSIQMLYSEQRERIALLFLAGFFFLASFSIIARDLFELLDKKHTKNVKSLYALAAVSGTVCFILAVIKFIVAKKLESKTVKSDGFSSLAGCVTGYSILISAQVISVHPNVWYLDNIVGFCVASVLMLYGIILLMQTLYHHCMNVPGSSCCCCTASSDSANAIAR